MSEAPALGFIDDVRSTDGLEITEQKGHVVPLGEELLLSGWAARPDGSAPLGQLEARAGTTSFSATYGMQRLDVARAYGNRALSETGFLIAVPSDRLGAGKHEIRVGWDDAWLPPFAIEITASRSAHRLAAGEFHATIDDIGDNHPGDGRSNAVEQGFTAIVSGRFAERPRLARAVVNAHLMTPVQLGVLDAEGSPNGFWLCFPSEPLSQGKQSLRVYASSNDGAYCCAASATFDIVPVCIASPPRRSPLRAPAGLVFADTGGPAEAGRSYARGEPVFLRGWAVDPIAMDAPAEVFVDFDDGTQFKMSVRQSRGDIAARLGAPKAHACGYVGTIDTAYLTPGHRRGSVRIVSRSFAHWYDADAAVSLLVV